MTNMWHGWLTLKWNFSAIFCSHLEFNKPRTICYKFMLNSHLNFYLFLLKGQKYVGGFENEVIYFWDLITYLPRNLQNNPGVVNQRLEFFFHKLDIILAFVKNMMISICVFCSRHCFINSKFRITNPNIIIVSFFL